MCAPPIVALYFLVVFFKLFFFVFFYRRLEFNCCRPNYILPTWPAQSVSSKPRRPVRHNDKAQPTISENATTIFRHGEALILVNSYGNNFYICLVVPAVHVFREIIWNIGYNVFLFTTLTCVSRDNFASLQCLFNAQDLIGRNKINLLGVSLECFCHCGSMALVCS